MNRRIASVLYAVLAIAAALVLASPASAANRSTNARSHHVVCRKATAKRPRGARVCATKTTRKAAAHKAAKKRRRPRAKSAAVSPVSGRLIVGLNADTSGWGGASTAPRLDQVTSQAHTKWLREEFLWSTIEPSRGSFDFSYYDHYMQIAAQRGMHVLAVLTGGTPSWTGATGDTIPVDPNAYGQFVSAVIGRYGPNGSFWASHPDLKGPAIGTWELWNEPYYAANYAPAAYASMVKAAAIAGRAQDPNAKFLIGAEMQSARGANGNWLWWVDALYQAVAGLNNYFNGVAIHPYGKTTGLNSIIPGQPYDNYDRVRRAEDIHRQFVSHGAANKAFWITEAGWSTCADNSNCVTAAQQAADLTALFGYVNGFWKSWIQAAFVYRYQDGSSATDIEDGYGLTDQNGTPKPALAVFRQEAAASA